MLLIGKRLISQLIIRWSSKSEIMYSNPGVLSVDIVSLRTSTTHCPEMIGMRKNVRKPEGQ